MAEFGAMMLNISTTYFSFLASNFLGGLYMFLIALNIIAIIIHFGGKGK